MKRVLYILLLLSLFSACKKDDVDKQDDQDPPAYNPFAHNDSLVLPDAKYYIVADFESAALNIKFRKHDLDYHVGGGWGSGTCYTGFSSYDGEIGNHYGGESWFLRAIYEGKGETREQSLTQEYSVLKNTADEHGVLFVYKTVDGKYYRSDLSNNAALDWTNIKLIGREAAPVSNNGPKYYIKLNFNCELTNENNSNDKIRFKNAVMRIPI